MRTFFLFILSVSLLLSCKNLDSADPSPRNTFIKFYEGPYSITASSIEKIPDGYVILGNMLVVDKANDTTYTETVIIKTDDRGNKIGDINRFSGGTGKAIKPVLNGGNVAGYIVIGDSILIQPSAEQAANLLISSLRVLYLDEELKTVKKSFYKSGNSTDTYVDDYSGETIEVTSDGKVYILGTLKEGVINQQTAPAKPFIIALNSGFTPNWTKQYNVIERTTQNSKSIHYNNGKIIWASSVSLIQGDFNKSWVSIPIVDENSVYPNYSLIGQNTEQLFLVKDIQPSKIPNFGYGVVGTYSEATDGEKGNVFFLHVDMNGNIEAGSDRYFDALTEGIVTDANTSAIIDEGEAITATRDGGFLLAGSMNTNTAIGNGGKDIFLIKINAFGDLIWSKTIGGSGDEQPCGVLETDDGDLIIAGTNALGGYSSVFLIKTDENGEIKK